MEKEAVFRAWSTDEGPPSHSVPPHLAAKAAARLSPEAFEKYHDRLMMAYFTENRDITSPEVLREIWDGLGLPPEIFPLSEEKDLLQEVLAEHNEAAELGLTGVPAVIMEGLPFPMIGVQNDEVYYRLIKQAALSS